MSNDQTENPTAKSVDSIDWLAIINEYLTRYDLDTEPCYGSPCMEPDKSGDYVYVWDVLDMLKSLHANAEN